MSTSCYTDAVDRAAERRAALDVELFAQGARALALARETRPANTIKAYVPKQREWRVSGRAPLSRFFFFN
jgi:hypothetical protein